jgi:hypothetical protein
MPQQDSSLDYATLCTIVGKLYIESQLQLKRSTQDTGNALLQLQEQLQSKEQELALLRKEFEEATKYIEQMTKKMENEE